MRKTFLKFILIESLILIIAVILPAICVLSYRSRETDVVAVNGLAQTVKEYWKDGTLSEELLAKDAVLSKERFMIISADGTVLYRSDTGKFENSGSEWNHSDTGIFDGIMSETDAIRKNMICLSVTDGGLYLGTVIMPNPAGEDYERVMGRILWITAAVIVVIAISYALFLWYVERNVVRPFERMKEFASQVAQGNLDEPLMAEKNNMFGLFTESFDMMREELKASKDRETALRIKEKELAASLSHDLRSPVTGIKVICELLEVKVEDAYILGKIKNIRNKTEEMNVLLSDLLSSALNDLGEMNVFCSEVTSDVLGILVEEHDTKKKVVAGEIPECILCIDKNRLSQVIGNIIGNSYKYADTRIDVSYRFQDRFLMMTIKDYGNGADSEEIPLLTNKFYRGRKQAAGREGSGLGLYISRELMEKMHGELILSCEDGFAATLLLPLA